MYDREYSPVGVRTNEGALLLSRVCYLTMLAVAFTALGSTMLWVFPNTGLWIVALIGTFAMLFVCNAVKDKFPLNIACLSLFAFLEGMLIAPLLVQYANLNGPMIIVQAAVLAIVIFAMVGTLGYTSTRSYAHWLPWLMGSLFALIIVGIIFWFVTASPMVHWLYAVAGCLIFVVFTFVDFTRIRHDYSPDDYIPATMHVYLDLINIFLFLLQLLGGRSRD
jgi:protein lifeguard